MSVDAVLVGAVLVGAMKKAGADAGFS